MNVGTKLSESKMRRIENFEHTDNLELDKLSESWNTPSVPIENDRKKIKITQPPSQSDAKRTSAVEEMSDREKIAYYRSNSMNSLVDNRNAIMRRNEGNGKNQRLTKMNSHNYDKLAQTRGLDPESAKGTKESFAKWSPDARSESDISGESLRKHSVLTRHASEGEKANITGNKPGNGPAPSGVFVAKGFPETPDRRKDDFALPPSNKAEIVQPVELARSQDIIIGQVGPQKHFENKGDDTPRDGGGRQIVTDGGFQGRDINGDGVKTPALRYTKNSTDHNGK